MATLRARVKRSVQELLETVKLLPPAELREFEQQFVAWRAQDGKPESPPMGDRTEDRLLGCIRENSGLPMPEQRRFNRLRHKRQAGALTEIEDKELQALWQRVESMNVMRLEALAKLAQRRGTDVRTLMRDLGLSANRDVI